MVSFGHALFMSALAPMWSESAQRTALPTAGCISLSRSRLSGLIGLGHGTGLPAHQRHGLHHDHARLRADVLFSRRQPQAIWRRRRPADHAAQRLRAVVDSDQYRALLSQLRAAGCYPVSVLAAACMRGSAACCAAPNPTRGACACWAFRCCAIKLVAYIISGCICGIAGLLLANLTNFTSPAYMSWTVSGDLIVMVMLGGIATILGPLVGATLFVHPGDRARGIHAALDAVSGPDHRADRAVCQARASTGFAACDDGASSTRAA